MNFILGFCAGIIILLIIIIIVSIKYFSKDNILYILDLLEKDKNKMYISDFKDHYYSDIQSNLKFQNIIKKLINKSQ